MEVPENLAHGVGNFAMEAQTLELKCQRQAALITSLKAENKELQLERNDYMEKLKEKRGELTSLQGKLDDTTSEIADLKRALIRANDAVQQDYHDTVQRPKTEVRPSLYGQLVFVHTLLSDTFDPSFVTPQQTTVCCDCWYRRQGNPLSR
jgi:chromosome segregation ATPase